MEGRAAEGLGGDNIFVEAVADDENLFRTESERLDSETEYRRIRLADTDKRTVYDRTEAIADTEVR